MTISTRFRRSGAIAPVLLLAGLTMSIGCASNAVHQITSHDLAKLKEQSEIQTVYYAAPPFMAWKAEDRSRGREVALGLLLGAVGGAIEADRLHAAAMKAGNDVYTRAGLSDTIVRVRNRFISKWQQSLPLKVITISDILRDDDPKALRKQLQSGMVVDFRTTDWGIKHFPQDPTRYQINYGARARLVRLQDSEILWQAACQSRDEVPAESPTLEEFLADQGTLLKKKFNEAADDCADAFLMQLFGPDGLQKQEPLQASTLPRE